MTKYIFIQCIVDFIACINHILFLFSLTKNYWLSFWYLFHINPINQTIIRGRGQEEQKED